ncbi:MAG TPA: hypothetical protein VGE15_02645 [Sphingobacteriaceae bacterium]
MIGFDFQKKVSLLLLVLCCSCQKEQLLVKKIEGTYNIEKIIYSTTDGDSVVVASNSTMFFDECVLKSQQGAQQCDGYIDLNGPERITFGYRPEKDGERISVFLNIENSDYLNQFGGRYIAEEQTKHALTLVRYKYDDYQEKTIDLQIFLKR